MLIRTALSAFILLFSLSAFASDLGSYLVFSKSGIVTQRSDYQGKTGSLGGIYLAHYEINGDLDSGWEVQLAHGSVRGQVRAPEVSLFRATGLRARYDWATKYRLEGAAREMELLSARLADLSPTAEAARSERLVNGKRISGLQFTARRPVEVYEISPEQLARAGNLLLEGNGQSLLLIQVRGPVASLRGLGVFVTRGLRPEQVLFHFPDARELEISYSGGAVDPVTGVHWGIPGSVLAPLARVEFAEVLVTGRFYVGGIHTRSPLNGGQVNFADSLWLGFNGCGKRCTPDLELPGK